MSHNLPGVGQCRVDGSSERERLPTGSDGSQGNVLVKNLSEGRFAMRFTDDVDGDGWTTCDGDCDEGATFRGLGLRDKVGHRLMGPRRIDYVFFRPRLTVRSVSRIDFSDMEHRENALPSDHYPVLAEFALAG